jgi:hypothetical protein
LLTILACRTCRLTDSKTLTHIEIDLDEKHEDKKNVPEGTLFLGDKVALMLASL